MITRKYVFDPYSFLLTDDQESYVLRRSIFLCWILAFSKHTTARHKTVCFSTASSLCPCHVSWGYVVNQLQVLWLIAGGNIELISRGFSEAESIARFDIKTVTSSVNLGYISISSSRSPEVPETSSQWVKCCVLEMSNNNELLKACFDGSLSAVLSFEVLISLKHLSCLQELFLHTQNEFIIIFSFHFITFHSVLIIYSLILLYYSFLV